MKAGLGAASGNNEVLYGDAIIGAVPGGIRNFAGVAGGRRECVARIGGVPRISAVSIRMIS